DTADPSKKPGPADVGERSRPLLQERGDVTRRAADNEPVAGNELGLRINIQQVTRPAARGQMRDCFHVVSGAGARNGLAPKRGISSHLCFSDLLPAVAVADPNRAESLAGHG